MRTKSQMMTIGVMHNTWRDGKHAVRQQGHKQWSPQTRSLLLLPALPDGLNAQQAADARSSEEIAGVSEKISSELLSWGDVAGSAYMQRQRDKERKRVRELCRDDSEVLQSLKDYTAAQEAEERKRQRIRDEATRQKLQLDGLVQDVKVNATLKAQRARLLEAEGNLSIKQCSPLQP